MKKTWKKLLAAGALALVFVSAAGLAACGGTGDGSSSNTSSSSSSGNSASSDNTGEVPGGDTAAGIFSAQIDRAEEVFDNFYQKSLRTGSLFAKNDSTETVVRSAARLLDAETDGEEESQENSVEQLRAHFRELTVTNGYTGSRLTSINSYICDIYNYSTSLNNIIEEYGDQAFLADIALTYEDVDYTIMQSEYDLNNNVTWYTERAHLNSATYAGADEETGMVYMVQTHKSTMYGDNGTARVEYYYNSDDDMGVTTVNSYEQNGETTRYGYYFYDLANDFVFSMILNTDMTIRSMELHTSGHTLTSSRISDEEKQAMLEYTLQEMDRITKKTEELKEQNRETSVAEGIETPDIDATCSVKYDFSVLAAMLGENGKA